MHFASFRNSAAVALTAALALSLSAPAQEKDSEDSFHWTHGPGKAKLGDVAEVNLPAGYKAIDGLETITLLELMGNPTNGTEAGLIAPEDTSWFIVFDYEACGYVKDDEKDNLDADAMLKSLKDGNKQGNLERHKRGFPVLDLVGWERPPRYDQATQNLVWAIRLRTPKEGDTINHNTRRLGRGGVMGVTLVLDPNDYEQTIPKFDDVMRNFHYIGGQTYGEWRSGDKVAAYGLTALVAGGGAAVAVKTGLFKGLFKLIAAAWKAVLIGLVAIGGAIKGIFFRRKD